MRFERHELVPMLPRQPRVCDLCFQWSPAGGTCTSCSRAVRALEVRLPPVLPMALAIKHEPLANALWLYKNRANDDARIAAHQLAWLLEHFMTRHEDCLTRAAGTRHFDAICPVPSSQDRAGPHPLVGLLSTTTWPEDRLRQLLVSTSKPGRSHWADEARFRARRHARGRSVLLVDDTWTTGSNALSAAAALERGGAETVAIAVIGRHFVPDYQDCAIYSDHARQVPFDFDQCVYCEARPAARMSR
jgi:predicted amidophosphoribosyltransferase